MERRGEERRGEERGGDVRGRKEGRGEGRGESEEREERKYRASRKDLTHLSCITSHPTLFYISSLFLSITLSSSTP